MWLVALNGGRDTLVRRQRRCEDAAGDGNKRSLAGGLGTREVVPPGAGRLRFPANIEYSRGNKSQSFVAKYCTS